MNELLVRELLREELQTNKQFKWYHLSKEFLGDEFTFTPTIPRQPFRNEDENRIIEDDFTSRVSWAPSIDDAVEALLNVHPPKTKLYVYATDKLRGDVDLDSKFGKFPHSKRNPYGPEFSLVNWWRWTLKRDDVPAKLKRVSPKSTHNVPFALKDQVPDAKETHEEWSTKPTKAEFIGTITL